MINWELQSWFKKKKKEKKKEETDTTSQMTLKETDTPVQITRWRNWHRLSIALLVIIYIRQTPPASANLLVTARAVHALTPADLPPAALTDWLSLR